MYRGYARTAPRSISGGGGLVSFLSGEALAWMTPWGRAEIRSWSPSPSGWWANCSGHRATGETRLGTFHEADVRRDTVDRSYDREV